jgi:hypothetical protein
MALVEWLWDVFGVSSGEASKCGATATTDSRDRPYDGLKRGKLPIATFTATKGKLKP